MQVTVNLRQIGTAVEHHLTVMKSKEIKVWSIDVESQANRRWGRIGFEAEWSEYKRIVQMVVETPTYLAFANKLFSEEERADIVALLRLTRNVET